MAEQTGAAALTGGRERVVTWQMVAEGLQLELIRGQLEPREHLIEDTIMERYGASRYATRRALEELQSLGLALRMENRGTRVRAYSDREVADLYDLRELLETGAARRIATPVSAELIAELTRIQHDHDAATAEARYLDVFTHNEAFHRTLFGACGNAMVVEAIGAYLLRAQPVRIRFMYDGRRMRQACQEHRQMIKALARGDLEALATVCGVHISRSKQRYLETRRQLGAGLDPQA